MTLKNQCGLFNYLSNIWIFKRKLKLAGKQMGYWYNLCDSCRKIYEKRRELWKKGTLLEDMFLAQDY